MFFVVRRCDDAKTCNMALASAAFDMVANVDMGVAGSLKKQSITMPALPLMFNPKKIKQGEKLICEFDVSLKTVLNVMTGLTVDIRITNDVFNTCETIVQCATYFLSNVAVRVAMYRRGLFFFDFRRFVSYTFAHCNTSSAHWQLAGRFGGMFGRSIGWQVGRARSLTTYHILVDRLVCAEA